MTEAQVVISSSEMVGVSLQVAGKAIFALVEDCTIDPNTNELADCRREYFNGCAVRPTEAVESSTARSLKLVCPETTDSRSIGCDIDLSNGGSKLTNCGNGSYVLAEDCRIDPTTGKLRDCPTYDLAEDCTIDPDTGEFRNCPACTGVTSAASLEGCTVGSKAPLPFSTDITPVLKVFDCDASRDELLALIETAKNTSLSIGSKAVRCGVTTAAVSTVATAAVTSVGGPGLGLILGAAVGTIGVGGFIVGGALIGGRCLYKYIQKRKKESIHELKIISPEDGKGIGTAHATAKKSKKPKKQKDDIFELEVVGYKRTGETSTGHSTTATSAPALTGKKNDSEPVKKTVAKKPKKQKDDTFALEVVGYKRAGETSTGNSATATSDPALTRSPEAVVGAKQPQEQKAEKSKTTLPEDCDSY